MAAQEKVDILTRGERKKAKKEDGVKRKTRTRVRLIPIWLRLILLVFGMVISMAIGAMIGYGVLGDGRPLDALKPSTWQHIIDLVEKDA
ncbi:DNA-directed RNA polymerase subunit beta [Aeribacillus composti]